MLFEKTYGIDLGSSSVKVYSFFRNKTYIEKNMIASKGHTIIAMGNEAYDMFEKSPTDITVTSPMTFGMIANLELQEIVLYSMIRKIDHILGFGATMYFTVPLDMTAVEKRAYFHVANGHWLKKNRVFMVEERSFSPPGNQDGAHPACPGIASGRSRPEGQSHPHYPASGYILFRSGTDSSDRRSAGKYRWEADR